LHALSASDIGAPMKRMILTNDFGVVNLWFRVKTTPTMSRRKPFDVLFCALRPDEIDPGGGKRGKLATTGRFSHFNKLPLAVACTLDGFPTTEEIEDILNWLADKKRPWAVTPLATKNKRVLSDQQMEFSFSSDVDAVEFKLRFG
jgi:hypothetical protein